MGRQVVYEAYGAGGSGFIIDCLTDNANRSAMEVRSVVQRAGGKMADPGSVAFGFRRCGIVAITAGADEDEVSSLFAPEFYRALGDAMTSCVSHAHCA